MVKYTQEMLDSFFDRIEESTSLFERQFRHYELVNMDLSGLDFREHDLRAFTLANSNLKGADLSSTIVGTTASFEDAIFDENTKMPYVKSVCPEEGSFIGYKKAIRKYGAKPRTTNIKHYSYCIVKLLIPEDAKRTSGLGPKCRCNKAKVLDIEAMEKVPEAVSLYDRGFVYRVGETVEVKDFDECRWHICAPGIHFYMERDLAILH